MWKKYVFCIYNLKVRPNSLNIQLGLNAAAAAVSLHTSSNLADYGVWLLLPVICRTLHNCIHGPVALANLAPIDCETGQASTGSLLSTDADVLSRRKWWQLMETWRKTFRQMRWSGPNDLLCVTRLCDDDLEVWAISPSVVYNGVRCYSCIHGMLYELLQHCHVPLDI